ncbi:MAG TPA: EamA family transporter [Actinomycetota bacterium]|nr:EamA family transporter [Actinomycetota bacterium]
MIAIVCGLAAALMWGVSALCTSRSTRLIPPIAVLGWVLLIGVVISAPFALSMGVPESFEGEHAIWLLVVAVGNTTGLLCAYSALRFGKVGVVAPIISAQGAAAAILALFAGEQLAAGAGLALGAIVVGVVLAGMARTGEEEEHRRHEGIAVTFAIVAAGFFGLGLYAMGRLADDLPVAWIVFPTRGIAVLALTVPLAFLGRLRMTRDAMPLVLASGVLEVLGLVAYNLGAREGIAITAIISSQFAAFAAVTAYFLFRERLAWIQVTGVVVIAVGVAVLTGLQV